MRNRRAAPAASTANNGEERRFRVGARYWPARTGLYWWESFSADEVRRDWEQAVRIGLARLVVVLTWPDFQPDRRRVSVGPLRDLETVLRIADDQRVNVIPVLFPAVVDGLARLPDWAMTSDLAGGERVARDPFRDPGMRAAEELLMREVVGEFADHPAIESWVVGDRLTRVSPATDPDAVGGWLGAVAEAASQLGVDGSVAYALSSRDLIEASVPLDEFPSHGVRPILHDDWTPAWAGDRKAWVEVLTGVATRLTGTATFASVGRCTDGPGCVSPAEAAGEAEAILRAVANSGGTGCSAADLFDYDNDLRRLPPYSGDRGLLSRGLICAGGTLKDPSSVWAEWSHAAPDVQTVPSAFPAIDPAEWRRRPEATIREAYEAFIE